MIAMIFASTARSQERSPAFFSLQREMQFTASGADTLVELGDIFLIPQGFSVKMDSLELGEGKDYSVDYGRGKMIFLTLPDSGSKVTIKYCRLPVTLKRQYARDWRIDSPEIKSDTLQAEAESERDRSEKPSDSTERLNRSGSIFRGIRLGTDQGLRLQSGLRLQVSGMIASNIEILGSLTDQNTPIQPEGNTQTLQEIDKVFVEIRSPGLRATLGDYVFSIDGSEFGRYDRKLQGIMGSAENTVGRIRISAAASKGNFTTNTFLGEEGNQGPYQLTGPQGKREIIVLAGTEKVWIDGELMVRGEENDYTIEYGNGQIIFTRHRLITEESRVTVDFEFSDQAYQKEIYGGEGALRLWNDRLTLRASFLREADDGDSPLDFSLTDENLNVLRQAGDNPDSAFVSGAVYVGDGKGMYTAVDSFGTTIYRYAGLNEGDYEVRFSYAGTGRGSYSLQGYGIFLYEGEGKGDYVPLRYLPLAGRHQTANIGSILRLAEGVNLEGELAVSDLDQNRYSGRDDEDNVDMAYSGRLRMEKMPLRFGSSKLGEFDLRTTFRNVGKHFRPVGRMAEVEHGRKWGVEEGVVWGERIAEIHGVYRPIPSWKLETELGSFRRGEIQSFRRRFAGRAEGERLPDLFYTAEIIDTEHEEGMSAYWLRHQGSASARLGRFVPSFSYLGENRNENMPDTLRSGFKFDEWTGSLRLEGSAFRAEWRESFRDDRRFLEGELRRFSAARTDRISMELGNSGEFSSSVMFMHRFRDYTDPSLEDGKTNLADLKIRFAPWKRSVNGYVNYRFSSTQISEMVRDTIEVGNGLGNYRFEEALGEFIPDPDGDVLLRTIQTGRFVPVNDLSFGGELRWDGSRIWKGDKGLDGILSGMRTRSLIRIERRDRERRFGRVNEAAFNPDWGNDSTVVMATRTIHQDVEYSRPASRLSMRFRFQREDAENYQISREGQVRHRTQMQIRMKVNPTDRIGILVEIQSRNESKIYTSNLTDKDIRSSSWTLDASFRPRQPVELALKTRIRAAVDESPTPASEAFALFFIPRFSYAIRNRGIFRAELEFGSVRAEPGGRTLPYEMLSGDQPGTTLRWSFLLTYRLSGHVQATAAYRGKREPWRDRLFQAGQVEVRAFF